MKRTQIILAGLAAAITMTTPMAASAAPWQPINQRQQQLDRRIDQGVRNGALNRNEAMRLRTEFRGLARLETQYRRSGGVFTMRERADLNRRFDMLSAKIRFERHDRQRQHRR